MQFEMFFGVHKSEVQILFVRVTLSYSDVTEKARELHFPSITLFNFVQKCQGETN